MFLDLECVLEKLALYGYRIDDTANLYATKYTIDECIHLISDIPMRNTLVLQMKENKVKYTPLIYLLKSKKYIDSSIINQCKI